MSWWSHTTGKGGNWVFWLFQGRRGDAGPAGGRGTKGIKVKEKKKSDNYVLMIITRLEYNNAAVFYVQ